MNTTRKIAIISFCLGLLAGCYHPKDEGCPTCFYDYKARYSIHGCNTKYDLTCWAVCNSCPCSAHIKQKNYWHDQSKDDCREVCCNAPCETHPKLVYKD